MLKPSEPNSPEMEKAERTPDPLGRWLGIGFAIIVLVPVVVSTLKFGRRFLVQFFLNPFQMFIVVPWALSYYCVRNGVMPLKRAARSSARRIKPSFGLRWVSTC